MSGLKFDEKGLIPVIVQDSVTNEVLMMAYANQEAYFFSRSRQQLWMKGETSGNVQDIISIQTDCDSDCLLVRVRQTGVACHLNRPSCFADVVHGDVKPTGQIIPELMRVIKDRKVNPVEGSYTSALLKKLIEEAGETALAAKGTDKKMQNWEVADLIFHLLVVIEGKEIQLNEVYRMLAERRK
jgi:phosphoribosyl-ATP pyrophosphohydrolase/phosphoribosyl-AMP cyclohydrolase